MSVVLDAVMEAPACRPERFHGSNIGNPSINDCRLSDDQHPHISNASDSVEHCLLGNLTARLFCR
jgi:hypothetical protein